MRKRVLILTSSTGGGHNTRARAFQAWAQKLGPDAPRVSLHKALENTHALYRFGVGVYNTIQHVAPWLHNAYFYFLEVAGFFKNPDRMFGVVQFENVLREVRPDLILSVHGSLNHAFFQIARRTLGADNVRCVTYCGELYGGRGFSKHWVNPEADLFIGAVPETCDAALSWGSETARVWCGGFLLDPSFYETSLTPEQKRAYLIDELKLNPDVFTLLLSTSARGANNHIRFLHALRVSGLPVQAVVLCRKAGNHLQRVTQWTQLYPQFPARPLAFTNHMATLLRVVDAVVARPGTGTTSESILSGCPIIFNGLGGVMPQESITLKYCRKHGLGEAISSPEQMVALLRTWIEKPELLEKVRQNMARVRPALTPDEIVRKVLE